MYRDKFSQIILTENDLCDLVMRDPHRKISQCITDSVIKFDEHLELDNLPNIVTIDSHCRTLLDTLSVEEFDRHNQSQYFMPVRYSELDIYQYIVDLCTNDTELNRIQLELLEFDRRNMIDLLRYLKYFVDTLIENNIVWGVGRGSSTSLYTLYKLKVHRIDSIKYDLDYREFFK